MNRFTAALVAAGFCTVHVCYAQGPMFTRAPAITGERRSGEIFLVDLNHDGHLDLITKYLVQQRLAVWSGDGKGQFVPAASGSMHFDVVPGAVALGDVDNDGALDLGVSSKQSEHESVRIFPGDGKGGFKSTSGTSLSVGMSAAGRDYKPALRFVDLNHDGNLDLVSANGRRNSVEVFLGDGHGGFSPGPTVNLGQNSGTFWFGISDLDGDGHLDLVTSIPGPSDSAPGRLETRRGDGRGGFAATAGQRIAVPPDPRVAAIVDVNGDGYPDIVLSHAQTGILSILLNDRKGTFTLQQTPINVGWPAAEVATVDVNRDGKPDLVAATVDSRAAPYASKVVVLLGDGRGAFSPAPGSPFSVGPGAYCLAVGDVNEDGKPDIATSSFESNAITLLLGR